MSDQRTLRNADDDWLDAALRAQGADHRADYLSDDGFTARVMAALPPPLSIAPAWRRPVLVGLWGVAFVGIAAALPGMVTEVAHEIVRILSNQPVSLAGMAAGVSAIAAATWTAAAVALRSD